MKPKELLYDFILTFVIAFIVTIIVTFVYNYFFHNESILDFPTSFRMAFIFGILFPWLHYREKKQPGQNAQRKM